jgi:hypothetical protein
VFALAGLACGDSQRRTPATPTPVDPAVGRHALTVSVASTCTALPDIARARTYTATIESRGPDNYLVTLSDAKFLADQQIGTGIQVYCGDSYGLGCNQFTASREGSQLQFRLLPNFERLHDEFAGDGGSIVELIPPADHRLGIKGTGLGRLEGTTIQASIEGRVWYCPATFSNASEECTVCENARTDMMFSRR